MAGDGKKKERKEKRRKDRPSKKAITNDVSFRAARLITSSSRRSRGELEGRGEGRPRTVNEPNESERKGRGEKEEGKEKRVFHLPSSIRSSPTTITSKGRWMINASVIISLQIFSDEAYANAWLIASPVHHFFNNTFLMAFRPVLPYPI